MWRINKVKTEDNDSSYTIESEFGLDYNNEEFKTYSDIKNKFKDFKIDEEFENELIDEQCKSISSFRFFLTNGKEDIYLFFMNLEICSNTHLVYDYYFFTMEENMPEISEISKKNLFLRIKSSSKFYKFLPFEDEDEYINDNYSEDDYLPSLELPFFQDKCVVCLEYNPSILILPCLHICHCITCDEEGLMNKCPLCREKIERKITIKK